jgi:hypothetical protein
VKTILCTVRIKLQSRASQAGPSASEFRQLLAPGKNKPEFAPHGAAYAHYSMADKLRRENSSSFLFHRSANLDLNSATRLVGDNAVDQITFQNLKRQPGN